METNGRYDIQTVTESCGALGLQGSSCLVQLSRGKEVVMDKGRETVREDWSIRIKDTYTGQNV